MRCASCAGDVLCIAIGLVIDDARWIVAAVESGVYLERVCDVDYGILLVCDGETYRIMDVDGI
jgi:hypothetical protein